MRKRFLLITLMVALFVCVLALSISAETPSDYIEFGARFPGSDEYISVYTQNAEGDGNPRINFADYKFYSDVDFTTEVDISTVTGIDFSVCVVYGSTNPVTRITKPKSAFVNCTEVKWFTHEKAMSNAVPSALFNGWSSLRSFDFGSLTKLGDNAFEGCGFETLVIPSTITSLYSRTFANNLSLKSVKFEGPTKLEGNAYAFMGCTSLSSVDIENVAYLGKGTFKNCTSLTSIVIPSGITAIYECTFEGCTGLASVNLPSSITSIGKSAFKQTALTSLDLTPYTNLTKIQQDSFRECKSLKTVKMPLALSVIEAEAFRDCTALEFVDFGNNTASEFKFSAHRAFYNCGELRGVSLPRNTTEMNNGTFALCKKLDALYIGEAMIRINGNKSDSADNGPTFAECEVMYFVQNPFSVTKEDGSFYSVTEWESVKPAKPEVYYFPSTLKRICGAHNVNSSFVMDENGHVKNVGYADLAFVKCYNLNKYLVFPEGFTGVNEGNRSGNDAIEDENQRGDTLESGLFHNCATEQNPITLVFMGRIDRISFDKTSGQTSYMTYMFANPANTGFNNTKIGTYSGNTTYSNQNEMYVVFCHAVGGAQRYKINFVASEADKNVPVLSSTLVADGATHVNDPKNTDPRSAAATCLDNEQTFDICFCGQRCNVVEVENTALGHDLDYTKDGATAKLIAAIYENGFAAEGTKTVCCGREGCGANEELTAEVILSGFGYSTRIKNETASGLVFSYLVNRSALVDYETANETTVALGVLAVAEHKAADTVVNADGTAAIENAVAAPVGATSAVDLIIWGSPNAWDATDEETGKAVKDIAFYFSAYVIEGQNVSYVCANTSEKLTDIVKKTYTQIEAEMQA